jgi:hypothetical protein
MKKSPEELKLSRMQDDLPPLPNFRSSMTMSGIDPCKYEPQRASIDLEKINIHWAGTEWIHDSSQQSCLICDRQFSWYLRRHHCRKCGYIFCTQHCSNWKVLPEIGYLSPTRVCDLCAQDEASDSTPLQNAMITKRRTISATNATSSQRSHRNSTSSSFSTAVPPLTSPQSTTSSPAQPGLPSTTMTHSNYFESIQQYLEYLPDILIVKSNWKRGACSRIHIAKLYARKILPSNIFDRETDYVIDMHTLLHPNSSDRLLSLIQFHEEEQVSRLHSLIVPVVIKAYDPQTLRTPTALLREIECLQRCSMRLPTHPSALPHPNIINLEYISPQFDRFPFIVTKYSSFGTLQDVLQDGHQYPSIDWSIRCEILLQILSALQYLHNEIGYLHNDICCANILVIYDLNNQRASHQELLQAIEEKGKYLASTQEASTNTNDSDNTTEQTKPPSIPPIVQLFDFHSSRPKEYLETRTYREFQPRPSHCAPEAFYAENTSDYATSASKQSVVRKLLEHDSEASKVHDQEERQEDIVPLEESFRDDTYYYSTPSDVYSFCILIAEVLGRCCNAEIFQYYPVKLQELVQKVIYGRLRPVVICYQRSRVGEKKKKPTAPPSTVPASSFREEIYQAPYSIDTEFCSGPAMMKLMDLLHRGWRGNELLRPTIEECIQRIQECIVLLVTKNQSSDRTLDISSNNLSPPHHESSPQTAMKLKRKPYKQIRYEIVKRDYRVVQERSNNSSKPLNKSLTIRSVKHGLESRDLKVDWWNMGVQLKLENEWLNVIQGESRKTVEVMIPPSSKLLVEQEYLEIQRKLVLIIPPQISSHATGAVLSPQAQDEINSENNQQDVNVLQADTLEIIKLDPVRFKEEVFEQTNDN